MSESGIAAHARELCPEIELNESRDALQQESSCRGSAGAGAIVCCAADNDNDISPSDGSDIRSDP